MAGVSDQQSVDEGAAHVSSPLETAPIAQAVRDWKGAVFGLLVGRTGWEDRTNPRPPRPGDDGEGHALKAIGFHMHDVRKFIIAKSS